MKNLMHLSVLLLLSFIIISLTSCNKNNRIIPNVQLLEPVKTSPINENDTDLIGIPHTWTSDVVVGQGDFPVKVTYFATSSDTLNCNQQNVYSWYQVYSGPAKYKAVKGLNVCPKDDNLEEFQISITKVELADE